MKKLFQLFVLLFLITSCGDDDSDSVFLGDYQDGVFVTNEGNFGASNGSVAFFRPSNGDTENNVYQNVNNESSLGDVVQSAYTMNDMIFIIINNSNKIEVSNVYTMESIFTIDNVSLPRYMTSNGGKGYVTEWVSFADAGKLSVIDLTTGAIEKSYTVGFLPEDVEVKDEEAYITEAFSNSLYVLDLTTENIDTITVGNGAEQVDFDGQGNLWVACGGGSDIDFNPLNDGSIQRVNIENQNVDLVLNLNVNFDSKIALNPSGNILYFFVGNNVFSLDTGSPTAPTDPFVTVNGAVSLYGIGVDPRNGDIYLGDSKAFIDNGEVFRYSSDGGLLGNFTSGIAPNGFVFN